MTNNPLQAAGNSRETPAANAAPNERRAFLFYTNWYDEIAISLTPEQQGEFLLTIVRYAANHIVPGDDVTPVVRTMFGLIRFVLDADLKKYDEIVELNKVRAKTSADKRRSKIKTILGQYQAEEGEETTAEIVQINAEKIENTAEIISDEYCSKTAHTALQTTAENCTAQQLECQKDMQFQPINNNQETKNRNQEPAVLERKEEALPRLEEVKIFWQERGYKSSADDFRVYYEARGWTTFHGFPLRSWQHAAVMWEDKFRRKVLPLRRREAAAEAALTKEQQVAKVALEREEKAAEAQRIRREQRISREEEADARAAKAVTPQLAAHMLARARQLCPDNDERAIDLLRRASDDATVFAQLSKGYEPPS